MIFGDHFALAVAGGEDHEDDGDGGGDDAGGDEGDAEGLVLAAQEVISSEGGHDEAGGDDGGGHVMEVLPEDPGVGEQGGEAGKKDLAVGADFVADGVLHPGVGGDDEESGEPRAEEDHERGEPMEAGREALFAIDEQAEEGGFEEEGEDAFHGEGLADDAAGGAGEGGPVGAELELHGDAGDDAHGEVDAEDFDPEARGFVVVRGAGAEGDGFEDEDEEGEAHRQLREDVVEGDGEGELETVDGQRGVHWG